MDLNRIKAIPVILLGMACSPFMLHAQGIEFMHDLDAALVKAKAENKIVFIDFYTSWCGPCKTMSNEVFPLEKVGSFYNKQFISCKVQCDDNGVGVELGKKYQVNAYPTLMYLDKNGELLHSAAGSSSAEQFIELGKIALNPDRNLFSLIKEWNAGNRQEEFVSKYFKALKTAYRGEKLNNDFAIYFNDLTDKDKSKKSTFELTQYVKPVPFSPVFTYIEENRKKYDKSVGRAQIDKYIADSYLWYLKNMIQPKNLKEYYSAKARFKAKNYPFYEEFDMFYSAFEVMDSTGHIDVNEYMKRGDAFLKKYGKNNDSYTIALTSLLGNCVGKADEGVAGIKWMEDLLQRKRDPKYLDTYFYILWRNFHFDQALEIAKEIRANAISTNQSTKTIDSQVAMIQEYREKLAKRAAENKSK
ncbi:thioredoxin fold domain-containing protein [Chitinophagaceae bacterium LB-8]|uniref:Thioredoxin fold domain-containing protein n=1 Tax=Paraflavisolibacter caeni TaxID=2982496 RepID=A0A9X2XNK6_9BACT|nr:thioredoxin fold domain-containing protein [Paraflavisolibacter caeni]MCU7548998.1 thioredoxin fold domain-containing protein [Paraflavisolibacter caeni]